MTKYVLGCIVAIAFATPSYAASIGGGVNLFSAQSASGGSVNGGGVNGGGSALLGATTSETKQKASTTGAAGTQIVTDKNGTTLQSQHQVAGKSSQTTKGASIGLAGSGGVGLSTFTGTAVSQGSVVGINGFLGF